MAMRRIALRSCCFCKGAVYCARAIARFGASMLRGLYLAQGVVLRRTEHSLLDQHLLFSERCQPSGYHTERQCHQACIPYQQGHRST